MLAMNFILAPLLLFAFPPDKSAPAVQWDGKVVMLKQFNTPFGQVDDKGNFVNPVALTGIDYRVMAEKEDRLQVKTLQGVTGWIRKSDAILLDDAVGFFSARIQQNPRDADAYNRRALCWKVKGEQDAAIKDFTESLRLQPSAALYSNRAIAFHAKKDYDSALADYAQALRLHPQFPAVYNNRGLLWHTKQDYNKAVDDYSTAIRIDPKYAVAILNRANTWFAKKDYDRAIEDNSRVLELDPINAKAYHDRGRSWNAKNQFDKALADYDQAIKLEPKNAILYHNRAVAWRNKKDDDKAIADFTAALKLTPPLALTYTERGMAWYRKKNYEKAVADFGASLQIDPKLAPTCNAAAWLFATCPQEQHRDGKRAVELAKQAVSALKIPAYLDTLAAAHAETGAFDEAVRVQEQALQDPSFKNNGPARARLELYRKKQPYRDMD